LPTAVLVGLTLTACSAESSQAGAKAASESTESTAAAPSESPTATSDDQGAEQETEMRVAPDLQRLADRFVAYALGRSDSFPHGGSVSMSIGGEGVKSIDHISAALSNRDIWTMCPGDWAGYAAAACPVDFLGPIKSTDVNDASLVYDADYSEVTCAPTRTGPLPAGRLVVLRPTPDHRDCARDFALALVADAQGRLRSVDLTLSAP
jgi:hypothetical protein